MNCCLEADSGKQKNSAHGTFDGGGGVWTPVCLDPRILNSKTSETLVLHVFCCAVQEPDIF